VYPLSPAKLLEGPGRDDRSSLHDRR
jgi:hypothetical protein